MRLVADAVTHHLRGVGHNDEGGRIVAADDQFQGSQFPKSQYRIEDLLLLLRIPSLLSCLARGDGPVQAFKGHPD
jgi:hypothetical protein